MNCTRCSGLGFLNIEQVDEETIEKFESSGDHEVILDWIDEKKSAAGEGCCCHIRPPCSYCENGHDVQVCDCCGDGENWHGTPGEHNYTKGGSEPFPGCA